MTEPNENGRRYRHGTLTAYNAARCRCEHCRGAYADYRAGRRAGGKDEPAQAARQGHRRAHPRRLVPPPGLVPGPQGSRARQGQGS